MSQTAAALRARGHEVLRVECAPREQGFDVLHAFHSEPLLWQLDEHWTRSRTPVVLSPVLPVARREERRLRLSARLPAPMTTARMRRALFERAERVIALTEHERRLVKEVFGARGARIEVIGNGVEPVEDRDLPALPTAVPAGPFALMAGHVSARKRQHDVLLRAAGAMPVVVAGAFQGSAAERERWDAAVRKSGAVWLGPVEPLQVRALQGAATAVVLISHGEALSLAVLEALAAGTPVLASDLPSHRELSARHPELMRVIGGLDEIAPALAALAADPPPRVPAPVPSWAEVADALLGVYEAVLAEPR